MTSLIFIGILGATAYFALQQNSFSFSNIGSSQVNTDVKGYCEPSNEVVDPTLVRSDPSRFPTELTEPGPFGCPRNINWDTGNYHFPTYGPTGGRHPSVGLNLL
jgi:hypothetical protein